MSTTPVQFCPMLAVAVEMSGATWLVGSCAGAKLRRKAVSDEAPLVRMRSLLAEVETAFKKFGAGEHTRVVVAYEAGQEGFWLVRELRARGIEADVVASVPRRIGWMWRRWHARCTHGWRGTRPRCEWFECRARKTKTTVNGSTSATG